MQGQLSAVRHADLWLLKAIALLHGALISQRQRGLEYPHITLPKTNSSPLKMGCLGDFFYCKHGLFSRGGELLGCFLAISGLGEDTLDVQILGNWEVGGIQEVEDDACFGWFLGWWWWDVCQTTWRIRWILIELEVVYVVFVCSFDCWLKLVMNSYELRNGELLAEVGPKRNCRAFHSGHVEALHDGNCFSIQEKGGAKWAKRFEGWEVANDAGCISPCL